LESDSFFQLIIFFVLICFSAFFSSAETAFFSLTKSILSRLKEKNSKSALRVLRLLAQPRNLLITILTGNTVVNVAAAAIAALLASEISRTLQVAESLIVFIEVVVVTLVLLILSEITPKIFAIKNALWLAELIALPMQIISLLLYPVTLILVQFPITLSKVLATRTDKFMLTKDELKTLMEVGKEKGALIDEEKKMIHSIFEFTKTSAREIMIPRTDMVCIEKNIEFEALIKVIKEEGHTRLPVYDGGVDNIIGILHAKELLPFIRNKQSDLVLEKLVRPAFFVPESKMIDELLKDFQKEKTHMAIVVDEYGGTAGLITMEDVIEEIVGEIQDEYDVETPLYKIQDDGTILVDAKIDIDELNEKLKMNLTTDANYESLGGYILHLTGSLPQPREEIIDRGYKFVIEKIQKNRIIQVRIHQMPLNEEKIT